MLKNLHIDTAELDRLKGISIGTTDDDQPFLIFTYKEEATAEGAFPWIFWSVWAVLWCILGFALCWIVQQWT